MRVNHLRLVSRPGKFPACVLFPGKSLAEGTSWDARGLTLGNAALSSTIDMIVPQLRLGPPVVPFYLFFGDGSPTNLVQKKGYPYPNLSTGGPRRCTRLFYNYALLARVYVSLALRSTSYEQHLQVFCRGHTSRRCQSQVVLLSWCACC